MNLIESYMDAGNIKFKTCFKDSMYDVLKEKDTTGLFKSVSETFYIAFAIGYHFNKKIKLSKKPVNHVNLVSFDRYVKELMVVLILKKNPEIDTSKELWQEVEEYAEYGIQVLFDNWNLKENLDIRSILKSKSEGGVDDDANNKQTNFDLSNLEEDEQTEFKSSFSWDIKEKRKNKELEFVIARAVSSFMNTEGGTLIVGVSDDKKVLGLENDFKLLGTHQNDDGLKLKIVEILKTFIGKEFAQLVKTEFKFIDNKKIALLKVSKSKKPAFISKKNEASQLFIRIDNATNPLDVKEAAEYISSHVWV